jgi:hypothetical protein
VFDVPGAIMQRSHIWRIVMRVRVLSGLLALVVATAGPGQEKRAGEVNTPPAKGERPKDTLRVGDRAPDFALPDLKTKKEVRLANFAGKKPVVLIFGSYT